MKGLRFNKYLEDVLKKYGQEISSKDSFIEWQEKRFSDSDIFLPCNYYRSSLGSNSRMRSYNVFASNDNEANNVKIYQLIIDPLRLARIAGWKNSCGYDNLIENNIRTAVKNGANIYQALAYIAETKNLVSDRSYELSKQLKNKDISDGERNNLIGQMFILKEDIGKLEAASHHLLYHEEQSSPYARLYRLALDLDHSLGELNKTMPLSPEEIQQLPEEVKSQINRLDAEILEFDAKELKSINDARIRYLMNGWAERDKSGKLSFRQDEDVPGLNQCQFVSDRIEQLEMQKKFENNKEVGQSLYPHL